MSQPSAALDRPSLPLGKTPLDRTLEQLRGWVAAHLRPGADNHRPSRAQGLQGGARAYVLWRFQQLSPHPFLVITPTAKEAEAVVEDLRFFFNERDSDPPFARRVHYLPAWDVVAFEDLSPTAEAVAARIEGLYHLQQTNHPIIVTTPEAVLQRLPPKNEFAARMRYLVPGDQIDLDRFAAELDDWGYRRVPLVEDRGDFAVRGGILDIFPPAHPQPLRLDLIGDQIETIRQFDPVTQRSLNDHAELLILPVREFGLHSRTSREVLRNIEARLMELDLLRDERTQIIEALGNGLIFPGIEFFLPYFYPSLDTLADYLPDDTLVWLDNAGGVDA
ncbi:MAG TPA: hypothetical protein VEB21_05415, partial [Terriglobales bacterium]|nr:hypothetical protein [Terriglobales bacterium]